MELKDYAALIITNQTVIVPKTQIIRDKVAEMSQSIWADGRGKRVNGRTLEQIEKNCESIAIEYVLPTVCPDFVLNPNNAAFDHRKKETYNHDVVYVPTGAFAASSDNSKQFSISKATPVVTFSNPADIQTGAKFEVKRWVGRLAGSYAKFRTFLGNTHHIDYIVSGSLKIEEDHYEVFIHLVARAGSFRKYNNPAHELLVYDHVAAYRDGNCYLSQQIMEKMNAGRNKSVVRGATGMHRANEKEKLGLSV